MESRQPQNCGVSSLRSHDDAAARGAPATHSVTHQCHVPSPSSFRCGRDATLPRSPFPAARLIPVPISFPLVRMDRVAIPLCHSRTPAVLPSLHLTLPRFYPYTRAFACITLLSIVTIGVVLTVPLPSSLDGFRPNVRGALWSLPRPPDGRSYPYTDAAGGGNASTATRAHAPDRWLFPTLRPDGLNNQKQDLYAAIACAVATRRVLVLPPFITDVQYGRRARGPFPFGEFFSVDALVTALPGLWVASPEEAATACPTLAVVGGWCSARRKKRVPPSIKVYARHGVKAVCMSAAAARAAQAAGRVTCTNTIGCPPVTAMWGKSSAGYEHGQGWSVDAAPPRRPSASPAATLSAAAGKSAAEQRRAAEAAERDRVRRHPLRYGAIVSAVAPAPPIAAVAVILAAALGPYNAAHIRRGDYSSKCKGMPVECAKYGRNAFVPSVAHVVAVLTRGRLRRPRLPLFIATDSPKWVGNHLAPALSAVNVTVVLPATLRRVLSERHEGHLRWTWWTPDGQADAAATGKNSSSPLATSALLGMLPNRLSGAAVDQWAVAEQVVAVGAVDFVGNRFSSFSADVRVRRQEARRNDPVLFW